MPKIQILPEEIRSKIAAGEVVERPASVVKELVENAFDAGASFIKILLKEGGIKEISVYDNGEGIEPEDLKLCYKHHATSKIKSLADIFRIVTFGFRGEALASIAQVSRLTIVSKHVDYNEAFEIQVEFGKELSFKPAKLSKGTLVTVRDLFSNLPARKAFLKGPRSETLKIMEVLKGLALCHPEIKYEVKSVNELKKEEKKLFFWEGGGLKELVSFITGIEEKFFRESYTEKPPYNIDLILTDTSKTFSHTKYLYILVNKRLVKDEKLIKLILNALKPYYGNLGFPAGVISIKAPYHLIDVNVHPAKWEVRFKDEKALFSAIKVAFEKFFESKKSYYISQKPISQKKDIPFEIKEDIPLEYGTQSKEKDFKSSFLFPSSRISYKYLGSFLNTYLLVEVGEELYIIDQHALCERVLFEELKEKYKKDTRIQELLIPVLLKISDSALANLEEKLKVLKNMGFELEVIKEGELILKKIPAIFKEEIKESLEKVLEEDFYSPYEIKKELLASYACKLARKKGDILSEPEVNYLLNKLFSLDLQTCPHGRPLFFKLSLKEIEEKLRRKL